MKRTGARFCVALITFGMGVGLALTYTRITRPFLTAPAPSKEKAARAARPSADSAGEVEIIFRRAIRHKAGLVAEFEVTNRGAGPLHYLGNGKNDNWFRSVKRPGGELRESSYCVLEGGLGQTLLPGESVTFKPFVGMPGKARVGFDFFVGEKPRRTTFWSDDVLIAEPLSADGN